MSALQPTGPDKLSSLPNEILLEVFRYLSPTKGGLSLVLASKRFHSTLLRELYRESGRQLKWLPLFFASKTGNLATLELCRKAGAQVDCQWFGDPYLNRRAWGPAVLRGFRPLRVAMRSLRPDSVRWLLDHGADPNVLREEKDCGHIKPPVEVAVDMVLAQVFEDLKTEDGRHALRTRNPFPAGAGVLRALKIFGDLTADGAKTTDALDEEWVLFHYMPSSLRTILDTPYDSTINLP